MADGSRRTTGRMRALALIAIVGGALLVLSTMSVQSASANYWRKCGDDSREFGAGWFNLKAHNIHCRKAKGALHNYFYGYTSFHCSSRRLGYELSVTRCTRHKGHRIQKIQWGSGA